MLGVHSTGRLQHPTQELATRVATLPIYDLARSIISYQGTPIERPLIPGLHLIIIKNYIGITIPSDSLNPEYPIEVAQAKPQPKDQI